MTRPNAQRLADLHILVAEDVEAVRRTIERGLSRAGARVTSREDGQAALELILTGVQADLLLTDLVMPRMGGAELAREVSKLRPELPVAFMTGYADTDALRELELADPQHRRPILNKPFTIDDLVSAVTRALAANSSG